MSQPTHALIDGKRYRITAIDPASKYAKHTHRVKFACGLAYDVWGEQEFIQHAVTDAPARTAFSADVATSKQKADEAAQKLADVRETYYVKRDEWTAACDAHRDAVEMVKLFGQAMAVGLPLVTDVVKAAADKIKTTADVVAQLKPAWDVQVKLEEAAHAAHAQANAEHQLLRALHEPPDQRWITSTTDVTDCPHCQGVKS